MREATNRGREGTEPTRTVTFRLPRGIVDGLEAQAGYKGISTNALARQILSRYMSWDRYSDVLQIIPVPRRILADLGAGLDAAGIDRIVGALRPAVREASLYMKGGYDLRRCIETLEDYMRASGIESDHRIEGPLHRFVIRHGLGTNWSILAEQLLRELLGEFVPGRELRCTASDGTLVAAIELGSDFDEHDY